MNNPCCENVYVDERPGSDEIVPRAIREFGRGLRRQIPRAVSRSRKCPIWAGALALVVPFAASAQSNTVPARLAAQSNESILTNLPGNTHPLARPQYDQGRMDPSLKMERITMMFERTAAQKADLDSLLAALQNPTSPSFHQWLTPAQFGGRFGIAPADLQKVTAWLQAHGLKVVETPDSKNFIVFEGTGAQVESALHVEMHNYATSDAKFYANSAEPSVPADLAALIAGFRGLNNYHVKPRAIRKNPWSSTPQPNFTSAISGGNFVAPGDFAQIYDLNPLYSATPAIDGTGQTIVVVGQSNIVPADIAAFRTASGLPAKAPIVTLVPTSTDPGVLSGTGDEQESSIDIEWAGAVAKNATIQFVYSGNGVNDALQYAVSQNFAPIISVSYGNCEAMNPLSEIESLVAIAQQANSQGITIVSSVGDGGATDCDGDLGNYPAIVGLSVDLPGSLPYVTGVGGTEFNEAGSSSYWKAASNGVDVLTSALSYIPEKAWNDSSTTNGLSAGGGGASAVFGKPTWQTGSGVPNDGARDVPDISINASPVHDPYLACVQFTPKNSSTFTSSCLGGTFRYSDNSLQAYGGTSFGAPTFAGILALINQKTSSSGQGNVNYILYPLAASSPTAFHDITVGDNTSTCVVGTQDCTTAGYVGFFTGPGYDEATGRGSIDAAILVNTWSSVSPAAGSTPVLTSISPTSITTGSAGFTLTATGSNFAANAQILWNGSTSGVTMLAGGTSTSISATISSNLVAYGTTASVSATYDAAKAGESSTSLPFTVNGTPPANDNIANATPITSISYTGTVDNSAATMQATDPVPPCAVTGPNPSTNPRTKTVWWSLTSATNQSIIVSTIGSVYDTTLSVWTGTPGNLTNVACNDDVSSGQYTQSLLSFSATAGTNYYIMVAPFGPPDSAVDQAGGKTVLNVSYGNLSSITATPPSQTVTAGSSATYIVTDVGSASFPLTCTGLPTGAACRPVTVNAGSTASLVITTTSRAAVVPPPTKIIWKHLHIELMPAALSLMGIMFLLFLASRERRTLKFVSLAAAGLFLMLFAAGCGSSGTSGGSTNSNGTPAGTYTITVTGSSSVSTTVKLTVT